jgi:hypothetical protein
VCQIDVYRAGVVRVGCTYVDWERFFVLSDYKRVQTDVLRLVIDIHKMGAGRGVGWLVGPRSRHAPEFCNMESAPVLALQHAMYRRCSPATFPLLQLFR